ncbi:phosphatase PAP2 family protein [Streptomyces ochraceiscleroticus]|uniref:Phosphatase PAP2 family protein n=1 Tax=Streptomyces ochraceiscleroticus TaxID=47761 RepID=A0ABW1MEB4_9ACTN|nr:phosphatase PAP2 family protein [Streptomyces ochraceiscleroticus]
MRETPRSQGTASDARSVLPRLRPGRALAHTTGASGSGNPHRSDGRPPQTPRGARFTGQHGRPGTTPPVPGRPASLSALAGTLAATLALFALLTWQVAAHGPLLRLDARLDHVLVDRALPAPLAELLADLGNMAVALPVLLAAAVYAGWRGHAAGLPRWWLPPLAAAVAMTLVPACVGPLQAALARPAPPGPLAGTTGFYPSGHAATAAVAYGAAALLLLPYAAAPPARRLLLATALVLVLANGPGLVVRGYHWPVDVLGSWALSAALLLLLYGLLYGLLHGLLYGTVSRRRPPPPEPPPRAERVPGRPGR